MDKIHLPQLEAAPQRQMVVEVDQFLTDLASLTPVQGQILVVHHGNYLQVTAEATTIITLSCDRCLQQYNHRLAVTASELIWLVESEHQSITTATEISISLDDPVESLWMQGYFPPEEWLYQQLCLQLPHQQLCDQDCQGLLDHEQPTEQPLDSRWAVLESLRQSISDHNGLASEG
ncbi:MAG: DUF177 domain-containing protein [Acaryochloridaceae cyanobacterium SU_2_1]|nr:DUF177 domain-containing protein [Acaryochloridaceae cyanobacterium SU_2_1]